MKPPVVLPRSQAHRRAFLKAAIAGSPPPERVRKTHKGRVGRFPGPAPRPALEIALAMMRAAGKNV